MKKLLLIVFIIGFTATLNAQGLGIGPVLGYQKAQDAEEGSLLGGGAVRMKLNKSFGVEGAILYRSEEYADGNVKVTNYPVMVTGLIYPLPIVYGAIGAGWYNTKIEYNYDGVGLFEPKDETSQEFGWHFGGGVELPVGNNIKLTGDIRYVFIDYDFDQTPTSDEIDNDFFVIDVGLLFGL